MTRIYTDKNITLSTLFIALFMLFGVVHAEVKVKPLPEKVVVLTFDDACASHYSFVAPLLKKHVLPDY